MPEFVASPLRAAGLLPKLVRPSADHVFDVVHIDDRLPNARQATAKPARSLTLCGFQRFIIEPMPCAPKTRLLREDAADASPMTRGRLQKLLPRRNPSNARVT